MNDCIIFRFVTRTLSEDYRVFCDNGNKQLGDIEEFAPVRKTGNIIPEEGPCAVLYEKDEKIFLAVSGMRRGKNDKAGRPIRFSFCKIYQRNNQNYRERAWNAFARIITEWEAAENEISEDRQPPLIKIIPVTRATGVHGEDIEFDEISFTDWLENSPTRIFDINFAFVNKGRWPAAEFIKLRVWPHEGYIIKWNKTDEIAECMLSGDYSATGNEHETFARSQASATGNITLKNLRDFAARGAGVAVRGMAGLLDAAKNSQPVSTMKQDRDKILGEIDTLSQQYYLTFEQKTALQKAKELLAFALTQKR